MIIAGFWPGVGDDGEPGNNNNNNNNYKTENAIIN